MLESLTSFFENEIHDKYGPINEWSCVHVVVSAPQLLPIWKIVLNTVRPAITTKTLMVREELGAIDFRSHFECIGGLS